ncbi:TPA: AAA family ATPase [Proteus mirabilis]
MGTKVQLKTLKINNLFGYKNIVLDFDDVNVLVGRNGLGKTTILKILNAMLNGDFNCSELKLCRSASIVFTNKATIAYERNNKIEMIAKDTFKKVISEHLSEFLQKDKSDFINKLQNELVKEMKFQIEMDERNYFKNINRFKYEHYFSEIDNNAKGSIKISKALQDYISNCCEIRYVSTINMSANAQQEIKMSSGKEKNILNWELNQELTELAKDKTSIHTAKFIKIASNLLHESGKEFKIKKWKNINKFVTIDKVSRENIRIEHLSSGERQLLYILSRVANTKNKAAFFLMDEPEISLHLNWQEKLISSIKKLNENCQIIIVTHSPAIVMDGYMDAYIDMSDITMEASDVRI